MPNAAERKLMQNVAPLSDRINTYMDNICKSNDRSIRAFNRCFGINFPEEWQLIF